MGCGCGNNRGRKAGRVAKELMKAVGDASTLQYVDKTVRAHRLGKCKTGGKNGTKCEHLKTRNWRCKKCGCFLKIKTWLPSMKCPLDPPLWKEAPPKNTFKR